MKPSTYPNNVRLVDKRRRDNLTPVGSVRIVGKKQITRGNVPRLNLLVTLQGGVLKFVTQQVNTLVATSVKVMLGDVRT